MSRDMKIELKTLVNVIIWVYLKHFCSDVYTSWKYVKLILCFRVNTFRRHVMGFLQQLTLISQSDWFISIVNKSTDNDADARFWQTERVLKIFGFTKFFLLYLVNIVVKNKCTNFSLHLHWLTLSCTCIACMNQA